MLARSADCSPKPPGKADKIARARACGAWVWTQFGARPARPKHTDPGTGFMRPDARALHGAVSISIEPSRRVSRRVVDVVVQHHTKPRCSRPCSWRSAAASACRSRSAAADADLYMRISTDSATTHSLDPACSLGAPRYNECGYASRARSCRCNNGMCLETMHFTSHYSRVDVVIYGATPDGSALCRDAVLVSTYAHGATCGQQSDARRPPTRS